MYTAHDNHTQLACYRIMLSLSLPQHHASMKLLTGAHVKFYAFLNSTLDGRD